MSSRTLALLLLCLVFSGSESRPRPMYEVGCSKTRQVVLIQLQQIKNQVCCAYIATIDHFLSIQYFFRAVCSMVCIFRSCMCSMVHNSYSQLRLRYIYTIQQSLAVLILQSCTHGIHYLYIEHCCNVICSTEVISPGNC